MELLLSRPVEISSNSTVTSERRVNHSITSPKKAIDLELPTRPINNSITRFQSKRRRCAGGGQTNALKPVGKSHPNWRLIKERRERTISLIWFKRLLLIYFIHMLIYVHSLCSRSGIPKRKALSDLNNWGCYNVLFHSNKVMHNNTPLLFLCNLQFSFLHRAWTMSPEQSQYIWRKTIPQIEVGMGSGVFTSHRSARFVLISDWWTRRKMELLDFLTRPRLPHLRRPFARPPPVGSKLAPYLCWLPLSPFNNNKIR